MAGFFPTALIYIYIFIQRLIAVARVTLLARPEPQDYPRGPGDGTVPLPHEKREESMP